MDRLTAHPIHNVLQTRLIFTETTGSNTPNGTNSRTFSRTKAYTDIPQELPRLKSACAVPHSVPGLLSAEKSSGQPQKMRQVLQKSISPHPRYLLLNNVSVRLYTVPYPCTPTLSDYGKNRRGTWNTFYFLFTRHCPAENPEAASAVTIPGIFRPVHLLNRHRTRSFSKPHRPL